MLRLWVYDRTLRCRKLYDAATRVTTHAPPRRAGARACARAHMQMRSLRGYACACAGARKTRLGEERRDRRHVRKALDFIQAPAQTSRSRTCNRCWDSSSFTVIRTKRTKVSFAGSAGPIIAHSKWRQLRPYAAMRKHQYMIWSVIAVCSCLCTCSKTRILLRKSRTLCRSSCAALRTASHACTT